MYIPGVGLMARMVGLGSEGPEIKSHEAVELIAGGVDSACHPFEVGKMSASLLVSCVGVATRPGLCPIAKETAEAAPTLCTEYGPNGWIDPYIVGCECVTNKLFGKPKRVPSIRNWKRIILGALGNLFYYKRRL